MKYFFNKVFHVGIVTLILGLCKISYAGISVCEGKNGRINKVSLRGNPIEGCHYYDLGYNVTEAEYGDIQQLIKSSDHKYLKIENGLPVEMNDTEKAFLDDSLTRAEKQIEISRISQGDVTGGEVLRAITALIQDSQNYKELTEESIIEKIKEQKGLN